MDIKLINEYIKLYLHLVCTDINLLKLSLSGQDFYSAEAILLSLQDNCDQFEMSIRTLRDKLNNG